MDEIEVLVKRLMAITGAGFVINASMVNGSSQKRHYRVTYYLTLPMGQIERATHCPKSTLEEAMEDAIKRAEKDCSDLCELTGIHNQALVVEVERLRQELHDYKAAAEVEAVLGYEARAGIEKLQKQVEGHCARIAAQS